MNQIVEYVEKFSESVWENQRRRETLVALTPTGDEKRALRLLRLFCEQIRHNPSLMQCSPASLYGALASSMELDLEVGPQQGYAYVIPYRDAAQFQLGYRGIMELGRRSGLITSWDAAAVREGDEFDYTLGTKPTIHHRKTMTADGLAPLVGAYSVVHLANGGKSVHVMTAAEIEYIFKTYVKSESPAWKSARDRMYIKTVCKQHGKQMPTSHALASALYRDGIAEIGGHTDLTDDGMLIDVEPEEAVAVAKPGTSGRITTGKKKAQPVQMDDLSWGEAIRSALADASEATRERFGNLCIAQEWPELSDVPRERRAELLAQVQGDQLQ